MLETARRAYLDSHYQRAEQAYEHYLQAFPAGADRLEAWKRLADIALDFRESPEKAATLLESAALEYPDQPGERAALLAPAAALRLARREYARAGADCREIVDLAGAADQNRLECHLLLARIELARRDEGQAMARYAACRQSALSPEAKARCTQALAELLLALDRPGEAEPLLQEIFRTASLAPALRAQAGFTLGQLREAAGDKTGARDILAAVRPLHPNPLVVDNRLEALSH